MQKLESRLEQLEQKAKPKEHSLQHIFLRTSPFSIHPRKSVSGENVTVTSENFCRDYNHSSNLFTRFLEPLASNNIEQRNEAIARATPIYGNPSWLCLESWGFLGCSSAFIAAMLILRSLTVRQCSVVPDRPISLQTVIGSRAQPILLYASSDVVGALVLPSRNHHCQSIVPLTFCPTAPSPLYPLSALP